MKHKEEEEEDLPFLIRVIIFAFQVVAVILFIAFTILTLGIFLPTDKESSQEKRKSHIPSVEEKLRIALERKKQRLIVVRKRIGELQLIVTKIKRTEKRMLFAVRCVICAMLIAANWLYLDYQTEVSYTSLGSCAPSYIELITNFNALILLLYSIPAYLLYGTVGRFTGAMKIKTVSIMRRKHFPTLSELQLLREEEQQIMRDIGYLKNSLELFE